MKSSIDPEHQEELNTLFHRAVRIPSGKTNNPKTGLKETVSGLLAQGADVHSLDPSRPEEGLTALMTVANADVAQALLNHDARTDVISSGEGRGSFSAARSPLCWAAAEGRVEVVKVFLDSGKFDINESISAGGETPLIAAIRSDKRNVVELLAKYPQLEVNKPDSTGRDPWMTYECSTSIKNHRATFAAIMNLPGIDLASRDREGGTPLMVAADFGYAEIVKSILAKSEADVNAFDSGGRTALIRAVLFGSAEVESVVDAILENESVDISMTNQQNFSALEYASRNVSKSSVVNKIITHAAVTQRNDGSDWNYTLGRLDNPLIQNHLSRETATMLFIILPEGDLRHSIIANFNARNEENPIDPASLDGMSALKEWHKKYLIEQLPEDNLQGFSADNLAEKEAIKRAIELMNNPEAKAAAIARNKGIEELASQPISDIAHLVASIASGVATTQEKSFLLSVVNNPEERFRLKEALIQNAKDEQVHSLKLTSFIAALDTMAERIPSPSPSGAEAEGATSLTAQHLL